MFKTAITSSENNKGTACNGRTAVDIAGGKSGGHCSGARWRVRLDTKRAHHIRQNGRNIGTNTPFYILMVGKGDYSMLRIFVCETCYRKGVID